MNNSDLFQISIFQKRFFTEWVLLDGDSTYNISYVYKISGILHEQLIKQSCEIFISRNRIANTRFTKDGNYFYYGNSGIDDFFHKSEFNKEKSVESQLKQILYAPFDLANEVLLRFHLVALGDKREEFYFAIVFHHSVIDGIGGFQIIKQIEETYNSLSGAVVPAALAESVPLPKTELPFKITDNEYTDEAKKFWLSLIGDLPLAIGLPYRSGAQKVNGGNPADDRTANSVYFELDAARLKSYAKEKETTVFITLSAIFGLLLSKYSNQEKLLLSYPVNMRPKEQRDILGCFVNNIPLKLELDKANTFEDLLGILASQRLESKQYQGYSFTEIIQDQRRSGKDIPDNFFNVGIAQSNLNAAPLLLNGAEVASLHISFSDKVVKDLMLVYDDFTNVIRVTFQYRQSVFDEMVMNTFIDAFKNTISDVLNGKQIFIKSFCALGPLQYSQSVYEWNETDRTYNENKAITALFEAQVLKTPLAIAVSYEGDKLTYNELNERSNQIARLIRAEYERRTARPMPPDSIIALYLGRGITMLIGMLGVLKAGGAYVPIDTAAPAERIDFILADTGAELIISESEYTANGLMDAQKEKIIYINQAGDFTNLPEYSKAHNLAYVIYTSGSTGNPKGCLIEHRSVNNLVAEQIRTFSIKSGDKVIQLASYTFDASVFEIFATIACGAQLIFVPDSVRLNSNLLVKFFEDHQINIATVPPALLGQMPLRHLPHLHTLVVAGESCSLELMKLWGKDRKIVNAYGPTETTVCATMHEYCDGDINTNIGKPLGNVKVYVLDQYGIPLPEGVSGQLHIGGAGVGRGYLKLPELTKQQFIPNLFATETDKLKGYDRLYKTGDMVRWLPGGYLEFTGRNDEQLNIHGHRIEPGEIEHVMLQIPGIKQCCMVAVSRQTKGGLSTILVAYYVQDNSTGTPLTHDAITVRLSEVLPAFMVPNVFIGVDFFPVTTNGKLNKKALPKPDFNQLQDEYIAPQTDLEIAVCQIWQEKLGLEKVGITSNFFSLGGDSIMAIQVAHMMCNVLQCDIKVADIFKYKTIAQLLANMADPDLINIPRTNSLRHVLSFAQESLWFIEQYEEGTNAYHIPVVFELSGPAAVPGIKYAIQKIIERHQILRCTIRRTEEKESSVLEVHEGELTIDDVKINKYSDLMTAIKTEVNRPFNLNVEYPVRAKIYHIQPDGLPGQDTAVLLVCFHHIACDGWSVNLFQSELTAYCAAFMRHDFAFCLPGPAIQYKDYATWQRLYFSGARLQNQLNYWKEKISGYHALNMPTDYPRLSQKNYNGATERFSVSSAVSRQLKEMAKQSSVTMHSLLLGSLSVLLGKYSGQQDIVTGSPIANRHHRQTTDLIGLFANMQVNRVLLDTSESFENLIKKVHEEQIQAQAYQDIPFEKLVAELGGARDMSRHPVFQVVFGVQSFGDHSRIANAENNYLKKLFGIEEVYEVEKFDLSIFIDDSGDELAGMVSFATSLFKKETIQRFIGHYLNLLTGLTDAVGKPYSQVSMLSSKEYHQVVREWNSEHQDFPVSQTVCGLFEAQAARLPDGVALVFEGEQLSYGELNEKSNQLARHIRRRYQQNAGLPLPPGALVALFLERGFEMVIGILGVLKAGGAYVPVDVNAPGERIDYLLEDTRATLVLCLRGLPLQCALLREEGIVYIGLDEKIYITEEKTNLPQYSAPQNLAYVIYTSGTTGRPKGVMQPHSNIVRLYSSTHQHYQFSSSDVWALFHAYVFDVSVWELWGALTYGGKLIIVPKEQTKDIIAFYDLCCEHNVTVLNQTPSAFYRFADIAALAQRPCLSLRFIILAGEAVNMQLLQSWWQYAAASNLSARLINMYGITETTVHSTYKELTSHEQAISNIGVPLADLKAYVLDASMQPLPWGITGELYISGAGLAIGYLNNPGLTDDRFISNPFATEKDRAKGFTRLYRSGDLVRWLPNGDLDFLGRNDDQVKIRGYRIELSEIEIALMKIPGINRCCVLARERSSGSGGYKYLAAYYTLNSSKDRLTKEEIVTRLTLVLPEYMIPSIFIELGSFPVTVNGKLDKRALPEPAGADESAPEPGNELEEALAHIWKDVLGISHVNTTDNFFDIGGDSLNSLVLATRIYKKLHVKISIRDIFTTRDFRGLAAHLQKKIESEHENRNLANQYLNGLDAIKAKQYVADLNPSVRIDSAAIGLLHPSSPLEGRFFIDQVMKNTPVLEHVIDTFAGKIGLIRVPLETMNVYSDSVHTIATVKKALLLAKKLGAEVASLTGLIPSATSYGMAITDSIAETERATFPRITTGNTTTIPACVMMIRKILNEAQRHAEQEDMCFIGLGAIGSGALQLMLAQGLHPRSIQLIDVKSKADKLRQIAAQMREGFGFKGRIQLIELDSPGLPAEAYNSSFFFGAANAENILDINQVRPGTLIVDDSGPHCFDLNLAIKRFTERHDILMTEGGALKNGQQFNVIYNNLSCLDTVSHIRQEEQYCISPDKDTIMGCVFSGILTAKFPDIPVALGLPRLENSMLIYEKLMALHFSGAELWCGDYFLDRKGIDCFRDKFSARHT